MSDLEKPRRWTFRRILVVTLAAVALIWLGGQLWPVWLEPGPRTTVITGPKRADGTIDYAAALNAECSQGVTQENNAVVLLVQALGPGRLPPGLAVAYCQAIGIEPLETEGPYLQSMEQVIRNAENERRDFWDNYDVASRRPWSREEFRDVAKWLAANEKPLKLCAEASKRERFFDPILAPPGSSLILTTYPLAQESRDVTRLLLLRAMRNLHEKNVDAALEDSETIYRLSRLFGQHPIFLIRLIAVAHYATAVAADGQIAQSPDMTVEQARRHREFLRSLPPFPSMADLLDHGERFVSLDAVQQQLLGPQFNVGWLQPNAMLEVVNAHYDDGVAALRIADVKDRRAALQALADRSSAQAKFDALATGKLIVNPRRQIPTQVIRIMMAQLAGSFDSAASSEMRTTIKHELSQLGFALAEYRAVHGEFPATLDTLVPELIESIPVDPFTGEPIRYVHNAQRNTILLYSVGENGVDDGGLMSGQSDDIAFGDVVGE